MLSQDERRIVSHRDGLVVDDRMPNVEVEAESVFLVPACSGDVKYIVFDLNGEIQLGVVPADSDHASEVVRIPRRGDARIDHPTRLTRFDHGNIGAVQKPCAIELVRPEVIRVIPHEHGVIPRLQPIPVDQIAVHCWRIQELERGMIRQSYGAGERPFRNLHDHQPVDEQPGMAKVNAHITRSGTQIIEEAIVNLERIGAQTIPVPAVDAFSTQVLVNGACVILHAQVLVRVGAVEIFEGDEHVAPRCGRPVDICVVNVQVCVSAFGWVGPVRRHERRTQRINIPHETVAAGEVDPIDAIRIVGF